MSKKAFTLIELLIVIAIITILASMLLPALSKARAVAQSIKCTGNLKQIGLIYAIYTDEYKGYAPPLFYPGVTSPYWSTVLKDGYGADRKLLSCPTVGGNTEADYNSYGFLLPYFTHQPNLYQMADAYSPSQTGMLYDSARWEAPDQQWWYVYATTSLGEGVIMFRHSNRLNRLCLDGHVETNTPSDVNGDGTGVQLYGGYDGQGNVIVL